MPDLLLELFCEEIPARMQRKAAEDLKSLVTNALVERGCVYEGAKAFATPRRLALHVAGLPVRQPDLREEKKGPRVGAPEGALQGFLKSAGLTDIAQAQIQSDPKKGDFYVAVVERPGRAVPDVLAEIVPEIVRGFPWPKSMRWGAGSDKPGALRWVRPLQSILCTFGPETETPDVVRFEIGGIVSSDVTRGHRFMAPDLILVRRFEDYVTALERAKVVLDADRRKEIILADAKTLAFARGLELIEDEGLLEEVAGLVEWPVVLMGSFDESFLDIPGEVVRATIRANQKCFVLRDPATGRLANKFILVSNIEATDGGAAVVAGNERVVRARLSDARHFWELDRKPLPGFEHVPGTLLEQRLAKLRSLGIVFHEKLGTQGERIDRLMALAPDFAFDLYIGLPEDEHRKLVECARRAAELAKADLVTEMVGEFPEVQGLMGRRYAQQQGEDKNVADAIEEYYKPQGPSDRVPTAPVSVSVALADKLDTLVGFWAISEKPTGSKDPYALRRAALGVTRILIENELRAPLIAFFEKSRLGYAHALKTTNEEWDAALRDLLAFFHDRLKVYLRDQGARHDLIDAVLASGGSQDDLLMIVRRVEALGRFLDTEDGRNLLAGAKRAANILAIEEKKDGAGAFDAAPDASAFVQDEEKALASALASARAAASEAVGREDFEAAMAALARLRPAVDAFFDKVTVNAEDPKLRSNRLRLLATLREATRAVADFSRIQG